MTKRTLSVRRETLRHLDQAELSKIGGGAKGPATNYYDCNTIVHIPPSERCHPTTTVIG